MPKNCKRLMACFLFAATGFLALACQNASMSPTASGGSVNYSMRSAEVADMGVTAGGAQDMAYARDEIERRKVPQPEAIVTEGLFSEYDLDLAGEPTNKLISLNAGAGMMRDAAGRPHYLVQIGMSSNLNAETFKRRPLNISLVIDTSGSMQNERIAAARRAASKVLSALAPQDYFSLVSFSDSSHVEVSSRQVKSDSVRANIEEEIDDLEADGSTNMKEGMEDGYEEIEEELSRQGYEHRLILITDARPNQGQFGENDFLRLVEKWSAKGVGLTAIGVGDDFGVDLATQISNLKGGNYRFVANGKELGELFADDFDFLVTPLAYDFKLAMAAGSGYRIKAVHGVPGWKEGDDRAEVKVATLFVSRNKGALAIEIEPYGLEDSSKAGQSFKLVDLSLAYTPIGAASEQEQVAVTFVQPQASDRASFTHTGVAKTAALAFSADAMRKACRAWHAGQQDEARAHLQSVPEMVAEVATRIQANDLFDQAQTVRELQSLMYQNSKIAEPVWPHLRMPKDPNEDEGREPEMPKRPLRDQPIRW